MSIEQIINQQLNKYPSIKKQLKRSYQTVMYTVSPKTKSEGDIVRISPNDPAHEYFFGYYDKSPEDATGRYVLCLKADDTWSDVAPKSPAQILLIDTEKDEEDPARIKILGETHTWNVQQGCMLQWLGPDYNREIIFNDFRDNRYISVVLDVYSGTERVLAMPVYSVSTDGSFALTLDFSRLHRLRPGYGYSNVPDKTMNQRIPTSTAVWKLDIKTNTVSSILSYTDLYTFEHRDEMRNAEHKVNHIMICPNGKRFLVLHRWINKGRKYTRLVTANTDGTDIYNLSDDDMVSHCNWKDDKTIIAFENKKGQGAGYYLMTDKTHNYHRLWPEVNCDGHPSYSPDGSIVVTDSYPNRVRMSSLNVMKGSSILQVASCYSPFKYDNDTRCDLHPRWSRDGKKIYFDSVFEGHRGLYSVEVPAIVLKEPSNSIVSQKELVSCIIPSYKRCDTVTRAINSVLAQTYTNIEVCVVDDNNYGDEYSQKLKKTLIEYKGDKRVRYIAQEKHINGAMARNAGIEAARGSFIAFLDDDDEWLPEKIEKQMSVIQDNPEYDGVTVLWMKYENGECKRICPPYDEKNFQYRVFAREVSVFTSTVLIRKSAISRFGGFDTELLRHQDLQFLINATAQSKFSVVQEYLVILHTDSDSNRPNLEKLIAAKTAFFNSVSDELNKYSKKDQKNIRNAHYFELVFAAVKEKKFVVAAQYLAKIGINARAYKDVYRRYIGRKH